MIVFLNGEFVPEERAVVSVFDRGFLYGDGLFETMRVYNGRPFRWEQHIERLRGGAEFLRLRLPFAPEELRRFAGELVGRNPAAVGPESLLRLTLSRGAGPRGYSPKGADSPTLVMTLHPAPVFDPANPPRWKLATASVRVPANEALATFKTCNKLPQILARAEAEARGADEALLLNTKGKIAEAASSNLFWVSDGVVCTTPVRSGILPGVTRMVVFELCESLRVPSAELEATEATLQHAAGLFLSLSSLGVVEVSAFNGVETRRSPLVPQLQQAYQTLIDHARAARA